MENLKEQLGEIKEQLFDAPTEVKTAFNDVVGYFASAESIEDDEEVKAKKPKPVTGVKIGASAIKYNGKTYMITRDGSVETITGRKVGKTLSDKILSEKSSRKFKD